MEAWVGSITSTTARWPRAGTPSLPSPTALSLRPQGWAWPGAPAVPPLVSKTGEAGFMTTAGTNTSLCSTHNIMSAPEMQQTGGEEAKVREGKRWCPRMQRNRTASAAQSTLGRSSPGRGSPSTPGPAVPVRTALPAAAGLPERGLMLRHQHGCEAPPAPPPLLCHLPSGNLPAGKVHPALHFLSRTQRCSPRRAGGEGGAAASRDAGDHGGPGERAGERAAARGAGTGRQDGAGEPRVPAPSGTAPHPSSTPSHPRERPGMAPRTAAPPPARAAPQRQRCR